MATWSTGKTLRGAPGTQLRYGSGSPGSTNPSVQNDGDAYLDLATGNLYATRSNGVWPSTPSTNIIGATGPASIVTVSAPPGPNVGVVGGYAIWNNGGTILLYGPKTSSGWTQTSPDAQGNTLPVSVQLTGLAGYSILSGSGAPSNSLGVVGNPAYLDTAAGNLYGARTSSGWPTSFLSLVGQTGAMGLSLLSGSGAPASSLGVVGHVYIDTQNSALYPAKTSSGWTAAPVSLVGATGLALLSGSGAPASSLGVVGQVYLDTAAGALYAAKTASGWPTPPLTLVGQQGPIGQTGTAGAAGLSVLFGSGPPASSLGVVGQPGYIDYTNLQLYSAKTASGWPSTTTPLYAPQILITSGVPSASTGNPNDIAIDQLQGFVYGPKSAANGWSSTPLVSTVGPAGPKGDKGTAATLPNNYTANSFVVIPVSGDSNAVQIAIQNASGTVLWKADASGNQTVANLTATGTTSLQAASCTSMANSGNGSITGTLNVGGASTLAAVSASNVSASGTLNVTGASTLAAVNASNVTASGTLSVSGQSTLAAVAATSVTSSATQTAKNFTLTSGGGGLLTFADGTTMATAASGTGSGTSAAGSGLSNDTIYLGLHSAASGNYPTAYTASNGYFVNTQLQGSTTITTGSAYYSPIACTVSSIQIFAVTSQGTITVCLYKNGVATSLVATYTGNSSGGGFSATASPGISVAAGDQLQLFVKGSSSSINNSLIGWATVQTASGANAVVKTAIDMGGYYSTGATTGTYYTTKKQPGNAQTYTTTPVASDYVFKVPFACTILGWSVSQQQANAGNVTMQFWKNGTAPNSTITVSSNATGFFQGTVAANTYNYAAGDFIQVTTAISSGTSVNMSVQLVVQWTDVGASSTGLVTSDPSFNSLKLAAVAGDTNPVALTFGDNTVQTTAFTGAGASRAVISGGSYYNTNTNTSYWTTVTPKINNTNGTAIGSTEYFFKFPFAASLTGWSVNQYVANGSNTFQVCKNRTSSTLNNILTQTAGNATVSGFPGNQFSGTWTKGTYTFAAGDVLSVVVAFASGTSTNMDIQFCVEWT